MALSEGRAYGRPKIGIDQTFIQIYSQWKIRQITAVEAMCLAGMKKNICYNRVKEYEADIALKK